MWLPKSLPAIWLAACLQGVSASVSADLMDNVKSIPLRTHTLTQPYMDSDLTSRWWDFGGDTIVRTDKYIRLTPDRPSRDGWIFSRVPLTATNWQIEVEFHIHGDGNLHGDGMAMWLTRQRAQPGPVFGSADNFEGLGIFIDTYKNNRPGVVFPYVMAMVGDGRTSYDKVNDGKANEYAGCSARGIRNSGIPTKLRLTYFQEKMLKLELMYKSEDEWTICFERDDPPMIPSVSYLGFSAETGELSDNHDLITVETRNLYASNPSSGQTRPPTMPNRGGSKAGYPPAQKNGGSWTWFFAKIFLFFGAVGGAYVGWTMYRTANKRSHRF